MRKPVTPKPLKIQISVSLPRKLFLAINQRATTLGISRSQLIVQLCRMALAERTAVVLPEDRGPQLAERQEDFAC